MKIRPDQLPEKGYFLLDKLEHKELPVFLRKYLNKRTTISIVFYGLNIFFLLIAIFLFVVNFQQEMLTNLDWAYHYFIGFSIAFLLVPLHEYIHVLAYKSQGAKNTSYDSNIKKFYFLALADKFESLPMHFLKFHGGSDVDHVLDAMEYAAYVYDVDHIILDNMQFMISRTASQAKKGGGSAYDKFDMQDVAIEKFRKFATDYNVHVSLVVHPRKEDENVKLGISSFYGSAKATQEADTVLILQSDGKRKFVDVRKNRFDGTLGHVPLYFDRKSGRYTETDTNVASPPRTSVPQGVSAMGGVSSIKATYNDIRNQHPL